MLTVVAQEVDKSKIRIADTHKEHLRRLVWSISTSRTGQKLVKRDLLNIVLPQICCKLAGLLRSNGGIIGSCVPDDRLTVISKLSQERHLESSRLPLQRLSEY